MATRGTVGRAAGGGESLAWTCLHGVGRRRDGAPPALPLHNRPPRQRYVRRPSRLHHSEGAPAPRAHSSGMPASVAVRRLRLLLPARYARSSKCSEAGGRRPPAGLVSPMDARKGGSGGGGSRSGSGGIAVKAVVASSGGRIAAGESQGGREAEEAEEAVRPSRSCSDDGSSKRRGSDRIVQWQQWAPSGYGSTRV